ncbi:MAG: DUF4157 domain-containing protein [Actinomycetota bacterium]|nr:DUF4157 domain-containing protein [Actinomycetota bacterium]
MSGPGKTIDEGSGPAVAATRLSEGHESAEVVHAADVPAAQAGTIDAGGMVRLQQTAGNAAVSSLMEGTAPTPGDLVRSVVNSPGRALDHETSSVVGSALGRDVSGVRLHDGPDAAASARSVGAELYASGQHVVAPQGLDTRTDEGLFKTVHEFVHIGQQTAGPVDGTLTGDGLKISDPSDHFEQEADVVASRAVAGRSGFDGLSSGGAGGGAGGAGGA